MRSRQPISGWVVRGLILALALVLSGRLMLAHAGSTDPSSAAAAAKLEASIFSYDGTDFTRTQTTLTRYGKSAVGTKLDQDTPAYQALREKRSYSGEVMVFGKAYNAHYAPLTNEDGELTGALFVATAK